MKQPHSSTVFAGLDGQSDAQLPDWYAEKQSIDESAPVSFAEAVRSLPRATDTTVAYKNPYTDEWVETERFNAIVEPSRLADQDRVATDGGDSSLEEREAGQTDPLFHIPSDSYTVLNPQTVYNPLEELLRDSELDGRSFADLIFGEI